MFCPWGAPTLIYTPVNALSAIISNLCTQSGTPLPTCSGDQLSFMLISILEDLVWTVSSGNYCLSSASDFAYASHQGAPRTLEYSEISLDQFQNHPQAKLTDNFVASFNALPFIALIRR
mmetsp:Transcript_30157/g.55682  ORF Transcript_30157/g.55682 Transcript_30157/m.55682 type:complete len:119 (+) Transcript_30157:463-819(+)